MKILRYFLQTALHSIWHEKWINFLTILSISIGLSIFCAFVMITLNMDSVLKRLSKSFGMVVYLEYDVSKEREEMLKQNFQKDTDILEVTYISKEQALREVQQTLGPNALILDNLKKNPLPSSFELKLKSDSLKPSLVNQKAAHIKQMSGVDEVQYGEKWLASLHTISKTMKIAAIVFGCSIFIAITFITYNTIKIFFYRRKEEMETFTLLGATQNFTRLPFLIEGFFIGTLGGVISALTIFGVYSFTTLKIVEFLPSIRLIITSLPLQAYLLIPAAGAVMSFIGSFIAVGKIRY